MRGLGPGMLCPARTAVHAVGQQRKRAHACIVDVQVTTPALAGLFSNGMEYFNTFGGCTAAGAAGLATLKVIREEKLMSNAARVGAYLTKRLRGLQKVRSAGGLAQGDARRFKGAWRGVDERMLILLLERTGQHTIAG